MTASISYLSLDYDALGLGLAEQCLCVDMWEWLLEKWYRRTACCVRFSPGNSSEEVGERLQVHALCDGCPSLEDIKLQTLHRVFNVNQNTESNFFFKCSLNHRGSVVWKETCNLGFEDQPILSQPPRLPRSSCSLWPVSPSPPRLLPTPKHHRK